ncbi:replicative DNA helicase [Dissulfurirhabdus thermomarina]|uniref:Replicative DNA helicase n=1 Tax=Dissulfurirhabdus thermomarina TaxID=1765737 RepID=A0A6N9TS95_DISTH|nr:replicative DNA helicase [Dissulfurirhabdus thermomarina]NDY41436.1 replicative DNA helicase [Dissulfurirhabdus thermomarina]NMX24424.1 replicative DNA helicase [Dissulfurirhabdus thermomarina]
MQLSQRKPSPPLAGYRLPPQHLEAEQCVLGGILIEDGALSRVAEILRPEDFYREAHGLIYQAMLDLSERNEPQDLVTVHNALKAAGRLEAAGGAAYLAELTEAVPVAANVAYYAKIVRDKAILRRLIEKASEIAATCYEEAGEVDEILERAEAGIFEISQLKIHQAFHAVRDVMKDSIKRVEDLYARKELVTGVPTGFGELDRMTAGLQPADLIIVAGRPSMGKTAFALNIAQHAALEHGVPVAVFSLEMSKEQLALRLLCSEARVDAQKVRTGFLSEQDWPRLIRAAGNLSEARIFIDDTPALSVLEMRAKARRLKAEHGLGLVVVDYLQLMRGRGGSERREQEISEISRSLKAMAKELDVPVVALSQLNRKVEDRPNKRPQMADLRESGAIEQDADVIAFIYRDEVYNRSEDNPNRGTAEVIVGKQRNGPTGVVRLAFVSKYSTFENLARDPLA